MKRMGIVLLGVVCLISSHAFSHASEPDPFIIFPGESVHFAWDETTKLNDREGFVIGYTVFITKDKKFCHPGDEIDEIECIWTMPTIDQEIEISFGFLPGTYYVGVNSALYNDSNLTSKVSPDTEISWSDNPSCTSKNHFVVEIQE